MYTSYIGKKLLRLYNQREGTLLSAREFFDEVLFPCFFSDARHLLHVGNSPFFQKPTAAAIEKHGSRTEAQRQKLHDDIATQPPSLATFVGYAAKDVEGTTSGQLSNLGVKINAEEMYASWIGEGLSVGINGGIAWLVDRDEVLWQLFEGWKWYRAYLHQTPNVKDRQIQTWNGHWLCHVFGCGFVAQNPMASFRLETVEQLGNMAIPTKDWAKVVLALARRFPGDILTVYAYNLSQTNTTVGFVNFYLPEVRTFVELHQKLFQYSDSEAISDQAWQQVYETFYSFKRAVTDLGSIGLRALEPDELRQYMPAPIGSGKEYKLKDAASHQQFQLFKTWIIAMLSNKTQLNELAEQVAGALVTFEKRPREKGTDRGKTKEDQLLKNLLDAKHLKGFIEGMTQLLTSDATEAALFKQTKDALLTLPADLFPLFVTLLRFEYQVQKQSETN